MNTYEFAISSGNGYQYNKQTFGRGETEVEAVIECLTKSIAQEVTSVTPRTVAGKETYEVTYLPRDNRDPLSPKTKSTKWEPATEGMSVLRKGMREKPETKNDRLYVRLSETEMVKLEAMATQSGTDKSSIIRALIADAVQIEGN